MKQYEKEPQLVNGKTSKLRELFEKGTATLFIIIIGLLFFFAIWRFEAMMQTIGKVIDVLMPIIYGIVIAFLLNPVVKRIENWLTPCFEKVLKKKQRAKKLAKSIGIFAGIVLLLAVITALLNMLLPELYKSIRDLVISLPEQVDKVTAYVNSLKQKDSTTGNIMKTLIVEGTNTLESWLAKWAQNDMLEQTNNLMTNLTAGVLGVVDTLVDILIGLVASVYLLYNKEKFLRQGKKMIYAFFTTKRANIILHMASKSNEIFSGFIIGKIIDSAIIGVMCFIGLTILRMPYTLIVSVIVGVTNVIPFFGPYFGAVPSALLILLVDPMKGLYFIIFIIALQQFDGNILGPKILGDSTGLSAFWVMFSIIVAGGLFGFVGMIMGVPTFAVIYYVIKTIVQQKLQQKNLPIETGLYSEKNYVDENGLLIMYKEEKVEEESKDANSSTE